VTAYLVQTMFKSGACLKEIISDRPQRFSMAFALRGIRAFRAQDIAILSSFLTIKALRWAIDIQQGRTGSSNRVLAN